MPNLKRKQIYLDEESDRALKMLAIHTKISDIFQMQPLFPESGKRWPFQFAKDGIWMYGDCFLGYETSSGPANHQSTQCIGGFRLSHSVGHKRK